MLFIILIIFREGIAERDMEMRSYRKHIQAYAKANQNQNNRLA